VLRACERKSGRYGPVFVVTEGERRHVEKTWVLNQRSMVGLSSFALVIINDAAHGDGGNALYPDDPLLQASYQSLPLPRQNWQVRTPTEKHETGSARRRRDRELSSCGVEINGVRTSSMADDSVMKERKVVGGSGGVPWQKWRLRTGIGRRPNTARGLRRLRVLGKAARTGAAKWLNGAP